MLQQRVSIQFRLKPQPTKAGQLPIHMRITLMGKRFELSTGRSVDEGRWNARAGKVSGTKEDARSINAYLDTWTMKVREVEQGLFQSNESFSLEVLKSKLTGKNLEKAKTLLEVFKEHNDRMLALIARGEYAKGTHTHFETTKRHLREFLVKHKHNSDMALRDINYAFVQDFEYYLKLDICDHNTAMKYLGNLKKVTTLALHRGDLEKDPFGSYKLTRRKVTKDFLMIEELNRIASKDFGNNRLSQVRDIFVFSCYTGLAYADVLKLKSSELRAGFDGEMWLFIDRQKTGSPSPVPLLPQATNILHKYEKFAQNDPKGRVLPVLSNQKTNSYLKEIADVCGIQKILSFHTARHTFATSVTLNNNVPIETVSKMLGHSTLKQTQHYAKLLNKKVGEDMAVLRQKFQANEL